MSQLQYTNTNTIHRPVGLTFKFSFDKGALKNGVNDGKELDRQCTYMLLADLYLWVMECHVEWDPKRENQNSCHHGDIDELLQNLLQHLDIESNLRELVELKEQAYPGNEDCHCAQSPLPLGGTEELLLNRAHKAGSGN